ncbi:MAG: 2-amino-4-hydroxy-6-hydroxymethyldihydropteridine diphosphokinase [Candidatus Omnitrophica bacterium]|nr:2-amino-4-hydroxy-6-hydroxymethyldihydropteridine diphosphokinase [Candidatus Omnitrophota bacterium]
MTLVFIGVGSNLGDRGSFFRTAARELQNEPGIRDLECSPVYETEPVGGAGQPPYLNAVWSFETDLTPQALLVKLQAIEYKAGRRRKVRNEARVLDLDILFYGDRILKQKDLVIPHPRIPERAFVLAPLCDLMPDLVHPELKKTTRQLLVACRAEQRDGVRQLAEGRCGLS